MRTYVKSFGSSTPDKSSEEEESEESTVSESSDFVGISVILSRHMGVICSKMSLKTMIDVTTSIPHFQPSEQLS